MKHLVKHLFTILLVVGLVACAEEKQTTVHEFANGQVIVLDSNESGAFMAMSGLPNGYTVHMTIQDNVSGLSVKSVDLQGGVITFVSLAPGEYQISGHGNDGVTECWVHGSLFQVSAGNTTEVNLAGTCHDLPDSSGASISVTLETLPNIFVTLNASSPSGVQVNSMNTRLMRFNVSHDGAGDVTIPGAQVRINYDQNTAYSVGNCWVEKNGVTVFDNYTWNDGAGNYVIEGTAQIVPAGVTIVLDVVCDTSALQVDSVIQAEIWSLDGPRGYYAQPMPIVGNALTF